MATLHLEHSTLSESTQSASKSTSTPISIEIAIPENEVTDTDTDTTHRHSLQSFHSFITEPTPISTPGITPINDTHELPISTSAIPHSHTRKKSHNKSKKRRSANYYRNLRNVSMPQKESIPNLEIHAKRKYRLNDGRSGICQFIGQTSFAKGIWVGIVLENGEFGNTNGTVYGRKYFHCREGKGLFVRPNKIVKAVHEFNPKPKPKNKTLHTHRQSGSMIEMSTSSPIHFNDSNNCETFSAAKTSLTLAPNKPKLNQNSQSAQDPNQSKKMKNKTGKKYKSKRARAKKEHNLKLKKVKSEQPPTTKSEIVIQPIATSFRRKSKKLKRKSKQSTPITPFTPLSIGTLTPTITPMFDTQRSKSVDNSPYNSHRNTPKSNGLNSSKSQFADIPVIGLNLQDLGSVTSPHQSLYSLSPFGYQSGEPMDALSALRAYFSDEGNFSNGNGSKYWDSGSESEGAQSDSMLNDEDWANKQHRARQESLAQTFADALTIPALHSVQQKVAYYIGHKEKWKPPKYDIAPDHSNILTEKLLHHKKHLDENINGGQTVPKKLGPTEIGTVRGYKIPKYKTQQSEENIWNGTFLDKDKGWYPKPNKNPNSTVIKNKMKDKHFKSQSMGFESKKKLGTKKVSQPIKKMSFDEEKETNEYEMMGQMSELKYSKSSNDHQRSQSQLVRSNAELKKNKTTKNVHKISKKKVPKRKAVNEWEESDMTWMPKATNTKSKAKKNHKSRIWVPTKIDKKSENTPPKKKKKSRTKHKKSEMPNRISLPNVKTEKKGKKMLLKNNLSVTPFKDTPQSTSTQGTFESISPYFMFDNASKYTPYSNMSMTPLQEFDGMAMIEDGEESDKSVDIPITNGAMFLEQSENIDLDCNGENDSMPFIVDIPFKMGTNNSNVLKQKSVSSERNSIHSLFMTDTVILEDSDMDHSPRMNHAMSDIYSETHKIKKKPENKKRRSQSLFSGASDKKEKEKRHKIAKDKYKEMNSVKSYVANVAKNEKKSKPKKGSKSKPKKGSKSGKKCHKNSKKVKKGSKKKKKIKVWKKGKIKNPPM